MDYTKKEPLAAAQSNVTSGRTDKADNTTLRPVVLDDFESQKLITFLLPTSKQAIRLVRVVAENPDSPTNKWNREAAAVNLSDIAVKYNPRLRFGGYELRCRQPKKPIVNGFGEDLGQQLWGLYPILNKEAAKDD